MRSRGRRPLRSRASRSCRWVRLDLPAHDDARDAERGLRVGDGRALAVLAARPDGVAEVRADRVDLAHELRSLTDERRAAERLSLRAVADAVALGALEGEVAAHHV